MRIWNNFLNLFFPQLCVVCETPLAEGEKHICWHCVRKLPVLSNCQPESSHAALLFQDKYPVAGAAAYLRFTKNSSVQQLIHSLKYKDNKELAYYLGRQAAMYLQPSGLFDAIDLLVPVPLHPRKKRQRGYNQAEWIARGLASILGKPIETNALQRTVFTETQTHKTAYERWLNMQNVFTVKQPESFQRKHILIIDDVITTGATTGACAQAIYASSEASVSIFSLAIAER